MKKVVESRKIIYKGIEVMYDNESYYCADSKENFVSSVVEEGNVNRIKQAFLKRKEV